MVVPSLVICIANGFIIFKTTKEDSKRKKLTEKTALKCNKTNLVKYNKESDRVSHLNSKQDSRTRVSEKITRIKPHYWTKDQLMRIRQKTPRPISNSNTKLTKNLFLISFSFVALKFPYLLAWAIYYFEKAFSEDNLIFENNVAAILRLTEIPYVMNYCVKFFVLWMTGSLFRSILKNISK